MENTDNSGVTKPSRPNHDAESTGGRGRRGGRGRGAGRRHGRGGRGRGITADKKKNGESNTAAAPSGENITCDKPSRHQSKGERHLRSSKKREKRNKSGETAADCRGRRGHGNGRSGRTPGRGKGRVRRGGRSSPLQPNSIDFAKSNPGNETVEEYSTGSDRHGLVEDGSSSNCDAIRALSPFTSTPLPATTASYSAATPHLHHHSNVSSEGGAIVAATPPTCMSRVNTHLSKCDDVLNTDGCDDHIAEQLAAGLLIDDADDTELEDNDRKLDKHRREEEKVSIEQEVKEGFSAGDETIMPKGRLQLVTLPAGFSVGAGGNILTADEAQGERKQPPHEEPGSGYNDLMDSSGDVQKTSRANRKKKTAYNTIKKGEDGSGCKIIDLTPKSASDAIKKMKAQEVSIGELTKVPVKQGETAQSLYSISNGKSVDGVSAPVINLLSSSKTKITGTEKVKKVKNNKRGTKAKNKFGNSDAGNLRAARHFNRSVRACVERSDPDGMREILREKNHHHFALDSHVLETVMKAYVMAAMFGDALYCLNNCTLPGTLDTIQLERILQCLPQNLRNSSAYTAADMIDALCIATKFDQPSCCTYLMRIVRGIVLEFLEEATSVRDRICSAPCEGLVRSARCVVAARIRRGKKPTDLVVDPGHQLGVFIPDTQENRGIQAGDAVSILPYAGPYPMCAESLDRNMTEATVTNAQPLVLRLQDKGNAELFQMLIEPVEGNVYRIDKLANRMGFNRQLAAAVSVVCPIEKDDDSYFVADKHHPSTELIKAITAMDENIDRVMGARENLNPRNPVNGCIVTSTAAICSQAVPFDGRSCAFDDHSQEAIRQESLLALDKYGTLEGLNSSQRIAVQGAASNRLTLVQGPPGTGKTAVAIRILQHWARLAQAQVSLGDNPAPILATSDSNIAVDNLVEGCAKVGLRVVRLGRPEAIRPELLKYCIDRPSDKGGNANSSVGYGGMSPLMFKEKMKILKTAQVVCCTCIGSGGDILDSMTFERVMVDEATQATEPAVLVPITRGCRQLVLVGDHCQLPPTVLSTRAEEEGLGVPLFSRMVACGVPPYMLDTQYRMHPGISMFPSDLFYGGKLNDGVSPPERRPLQGFPWPREEFPIAFIPVVDCMEIDDGGSKANEGEALEVYNAVVHLLNGGQATVSDIAVVTPYAAQVRLIRRQLRDMLPRGPPFVEVSTTDGFQGREKEAVIFSAVRSNPHGTVGFVSDWRRINVSFTRARRALIVIGNPDTLRRGDPNTLGAWLQWADAHGVNMMNPGKPRGRYDPEVLRKVRGGTTAAEMLKDVLDRQQAQVKTAEQQQARAVMNAAGHIMGKEEVREKESDDHPQALRDDLAMLENTDGCWDDSDHDGDGIVYNASRVSITHECNSWEGKTSDGSRDAWDL